MTAFLAHTQESFGFKNRKSPRRKKKPSLGTRYLEVGEKRRLLQSTLDFGLTCHFKESLHRLL
jgi:hypothetical protein